MGRYCQDTVSSTRGGSDCNKICNKIQAAQLKFTNNMLLPQFLYRLNTHDIA